MSAPKATYVQLGRVVRRLRKSRRMTQERLADLAGMHLTYLSEIELHGSNLSWNMLTGLATGLDLTLVELMAQVEEEARRDHATVEPPSRESPEA
ncbi:MAG TPA: helix-turn-helix transcriptional regulator [Solirubrobacteraceae bacterium]|nr:helix-turn-helix transcriptional regulator [Solirubrobacteraceae bacterium]